MVFTVNLALFHLLFSTLEILEEQDATSYYVVFRSQSQSFTVAVKSLNICHRCDLKSQKPEGKREHLFIKAPCLISQSDDYKVSELDLNSRDLKKF